MPFRFPQGNWTHARSRERQFTITPRFPEPSRSRSRRRMCRGTLWTELRRSTGSAAGSSTPTTWSATETATILPSAVRLGKKSLIRHANYCWFFVCFAASQSPFTVQFKSDDDEVVEAEIAGIAEKAQVNEQAQIPGGIVGFYLRYELIDC